MPSDLTIRNVRILDGTGAPAFEGDVEVTDGRIKSIGRAGAAAREVDGRGLVLAPGFIDTHSHDDGAFFSYPGMEFKLAQGCTTVVSGNCGFSAAPADPERDSVAASGGILAGLAGGWTDLAGYFAAAAERRPAINNLMLVGHNTMRSLAMGYEQRPPSAEELAQMRGWTEQAMAQGACGLSTGLIYRPGRWSETDEVIRLAEAVAPFGGLYATHMRSEGAALLQSVEETLRIGREAGLPVHISHHKASGKANWGMVKDSLARVDRAVAEGQQVTLDVYPYTAGSGRMIEYFDLENISRDLAEVIRIASCPAFRDFEGRMLRDIAAERGIDVTEAVRLVLIAERGDRTICIQFTIDEADVETNLRHPRVMIGSDGIPDLNGRPHPRLFGTFPRVLGEYVRERKVVALEEAVRRMTSLPAARFGLAGRGRVAEGFWADLVLFDPARVRDLATYDDPQREPEGIEMVIVNGRVACEGGIHTGVGSGRMLRYRVE